jgi:hypothetical protein
MLKIFKLKIISISDKSTPLRRVGSKKIVDEIFYKICLIYADWKCHVLKAGIQTRSDNDK